MISGTIFEQKTYDRMMDGNLPPWVREHMIKKIVAIMPDKRAFRPYTMAKVLGVHGKTASRLVKEAHKVWWERNWWKIAIEKERLRRQIDEIWT